MKNLFKIRYLGILVAAWLPLASLAAEGPAGAADGKRPSVEAHQAHQARMEQCRADPQKCRVERQARHDQWCKDHADRCKEIQARMERRKAECKADPEKCRAERQARFEQRFKTADADGNGMISRAEAEKAMPRLMRHFDRVDTNKDGQISRDEITSSRKAFYERRHRDGAGRAESSKI